MAGLYPDYGAAARDATNYLAVREGLAERQARRIRQQQKDQADAAHNQAVSSATRRYVAGDQQAATDLLAIDPDRFDKVLDIEAKRRKISREELETQAVDLARVAAAAATNPGGYDSLRREYIGRHGKKAADDLPEDVTHPDFMLWAKASIRAASGIAELAKLGGAPKSTVTEVGGTTQGSRQRVNALADPMTGQIITQNIGPQMTPAPHAPTASYGVFETGAEGVPGGRTVNVLDKRTGTYKAVGAPKLPTPAGASRRGGGEGEGGSLKSADENAIVRMVGSLFDSMVDPMTGQIQLMNENDRPVVQGIAEAATRLLADSGGSMTRAEAVSAAARQFGIAIPTATAKAAEQKAQASDPAGIRNWIGRQ